jgi:hypothetical protein
MSTTITSLVGTQLTDGTARVHVTATVTDSGSKTIGLAYRFKHVADSAWQTAVTTGPASIAATPGGAALNFYWDLDASSIDTTTTANFDFEIVATVPAIAATGSFTAVAANATTGIKDGDTLVIAGHTYEFDSTGAVSDPAHIAITLASATDTAAVVATELIAAVNGDATAAVTASAGSGTTVNFTEDVPGAAGNVAITYTFANSITPTKTGMSGGADVATVTSSVIVLTGAATDAVAPLSEAVTVPASVAAAETATTPPLKNVLVVRRFEGTKTVLGSQPQDFVKGTQAYAVLDALRNGSYAKFNYDVHYSKLNNELTVQQMDTRGALANMAFPGSPAQAEPYLSVGTARRGVVLSVAEYTRVTVGHTLSATLQSKQWFAYKAWRSFTRYFTDTTKVYAIYEDTFTNGMQGTKVLTKTVIAYLMLDSYYETLRG